MCTSAYSRRNELTGWGDIKCGEDKARATNETKKEGMESYSDVTICAIYPTRWKIERRLVALTYNFCLLLPHGGINQIAEWNHVECDPLMWDQHAAAEWLFPYNKGMVNGSTLVNFNCEAMLSCLWEVGRWTMSAEPCSLIWIVGTNLPAGYQLTRTIFLSLYVQLLLSCKCSCPHGFIQKLADKLSHTKLQYKVLSSGQGKKPHHIAQAFESSTTSDLSNWSSRTPASGPLEVADEVSLQKCEPCVCTLVESVLHLLISSHIAKSCWVTAAVGAIVVTRYLHLLRRRYKLTRQKSVPLLWYIQFCIPSQPYCLLARETIASWSFSVFRCGINTTEHTLQRHYDMQDLWCSVRKG